jgi:hypothetical protein
MEGHQPTVVRAELISPHHSPRWRAPASGRGPGPIHGLRRARLIPEPRHLLLRGLPPLPGQRPRPPTDWAVTSKIALDTGVAVEIGAQAQQVRPHAAIQPCRGPMGSSPKRDRCL